IRDGLVLPGRMMHFASSSLASAVESIRAYRAKVVAVDALFAQTTSGVSFLARLDSMLPANAIRLIVQQPDGRWIAASRQEPPLVVGDRRPAGATQAGVASPQAAGAVTSALAGAAQAAANTRRPPPLLLPRPAGAP